MTVTFKRIYNRVVRRLMPWDSAAPKYLSDVVVPVILIDDFSGGEIVVISSDDPAAGADPSYTVPNNTLLILHTVAVTLVAAVAAANRVPHLVIDDGVDIALNLPSNVATTSGVTNTYQWGQFGARQAAIAGQIVEALPAPLPIGPNFRIRIVSDALQAGDNYGNMSILARRLVMDPETPE